VTARLDQGDVARAALLHESAEELYENAPVAYLSTLLDGTIVRVNETLVRWTGHARKDLVGRKRLHDLLPPGARIYYETHYAPLLQMQGSVREIAVELLRADGTRLPVLLNSTVVGGEEGTPQIVRTTAFDASDRRRYERELLRARADAESRARAALALAHVNDGVLLVDEDGKVQLLNPAAEAIVDVAAHDVLGQPAEKAIRWWSEIAGRIPVGRIDARPAAEVVVVNDGEREQWLAAVGIEASGSVVYTFRDLTADRQLEQLRSDVLAVVSHELRTPLTGLYGAAATLLARGSDLDDDRRRSLLEMVVEQTARLTGIVDQILLASRLDARNDTPLELETFEAAAVFEPVLQLVAPEQRARVVVEVRPGIVACGDPDRLRQVIHNLVDNALKYSRGQVRLRVEARAATTRFTVSDDGPGIPPAERTRIFEKFYRLDPQQHQGTGGTGLGLYIARALVERMGGRIGLLPRERGATFYVDLPRL
jgi:PAS domain S-box-containing protein